MKGAKVCGRTIGDEQCASDAFYVVEGEGFFDFVCQICSFRHHVVLIETEDEPVAPSKEWTGCHC